MLAGDALRRRLLAMVTALALLTLGMIAVTSGTNSARADTDPPAGTPATVSADPLPTWQINGVVWSQVTIGDTVYAAGEFSQARPPGVAVGGAGSVNVGNLIAYNITTGNLITSFNHILNAQALVLAKSPDNSRIYVGGDFTTVDGQARGHIAAFNVATGALDASFHPTTDQEVKAIAVTGTTVYAGGQFSSAGGSARSRLAAFNASNGALLPWAPTTDGHYIWSMIMTPDQSKVVIGGQIQTINGTTANGMGAVDATTGASTSWAASQSIVDYNSGAIMGLSTDGTSIFGSGFAFGTGGKFEGEFSLNPSDGSINWLNDCQGDTYDTWPMGGMVYTVSHVHNCEMIGGLTQLSDWSINQRHALAFATTANTVNNGPDQYGWNYKGFAGSKVQTWYPTLSWGNYTQYGQSGWSITGNSDYLALGGEFLAAGGVGQQGLVRYAVKGKAPNKLGPAACYQAPTPSARSVPGAAAAVSWQAATDPDNAKLTYQVYRSGTPAAIYTTTQSNDYWNCPQMSFVDTGLTTGSSYTYTVKATDPFGNTYTLPTTNSVTAAGGSLSGYAKDVLADGARAFWRLGEASGSAVLDTAGFNDATAKSGVNRGVTGPIAGDPTTASTFSGSTSGYAATNSTIPTTPSFSIETWVKTTTRRGGKIVGYGDSASGTSSSYDRHVYMDNSGHFYFGVFPGSTQVVSSPGTYNDGSWHHVVATLDQSAGMALYVDGKQVAVNGSVTSAQTYTGYWRIGGDSLGSWPGSPSSNFFAGTIGDVAIYPSALSPAEVADHYIDGGGTLPNRPPVASFTSSASDLQASFDGSGSSDPEGPIASYSWDFGDNSATGSGATPQHTYAAAGTYTVKLTVTDAGGATASVSHDVTVTAPPPAPTLLASDDFGRTVTTGWGPLDSGGSWTGSGSGLSVGGGTGRFTIATAGAGPRAFANAVSTTQADTHVQLSMDTAPTGGGMYAYVIGRRITGVGDYRAKVWLKNDGRVYIAISRMNGNTEVATVPLQVVDGLTYTPGTALNVRFDATGTSPTTLQAKVWAAGTTEPATWQVQATDQTAALQAPGGVGVSTYLSGSATTSPVVVSVDNLRVYDATTLNVQRVQAMAKGVPVQPLQTVTKANSSRLHARSRWSKP